MRYPYPRPILVKVEKIIGFILLIVGAFALLKLFGILDPELLIATEYLGWFTAGVCVFFGFILMTHKQHGLA